MHTCLHTHAYTHAYTHVYTHVHTQVYTHVYTHVHTCPHTCPHKFESDNRPVQAALIDTDGAAFLRALVPTIALANTQPHPRPLGFPVCEPERDLYNPSYYYYYIIYY